MLPKGLPRNPRELPVSSGPEYWSGGTQSPRVDQRGHGRMGEQSYDPIVPVKVGNRRALERGGHGTHRREGGNKRTHLPKGDITGTQNSDHYVHRHRQNSRTCQGRSATTILLDRSPNHSRRTACGIPGSKKRSQCRDRRRHVRGVSASYISGSRRASISASHSAECISPRKTGSRGLSRFPPWRTSSCRRQRWNC